MPEFILMLTRNDETVADARALYARLRANKVRHVGFKDVGLPEHELRTLLADIRADGHTAHMEVVAETREATLASARMAAALRPDYLLGGTLIEPVQEIVAGTGVRFFPYVGEVVGHPCMLRGSIERICDDARRAEAAGVDGLNLLAYRYDGAVPELVERVCAATSLPVLCAGSIVSVEQIRTLAGLGVWGFTVGTAVLDGAIVAGELEDQVDAVLRAAG
jgi:NAD(P)H-dependent flavin oxidoreductase YrpB (nitropropane dioxygenase family)